jgi:hypothetical protein
MYIKIENHAENTTKIIDYPGDMSLFIAAHSFGVFNVIKIKPGVYSFMDRFTGEIIDTISKPGKREITKFLKGDLKK